MQPTIRQYYHLEELWGDKPVKLKLGAPAPLVKAAKVEVKPEPEITVKAGKKVAGKKTAAKKTGTKKTAVKAPVRIPTTTVDPSYVGRVGKTNDWTARRNVTETAAEPVAKPVAKVRKPAAKNPIVKVPVAKKVVAEKVAAKKVAAKKVASKTAVQKAAPRKSAPRSK
jgi:ribosome-associated protein